MTEVEKLLTELNSTYEEYVSKMNALMKDLREIVKLETKPVKIDPSQIQDLNKDPRITADTVYVSVTNLRNAIKTLFKIERRTGNNREIYAFMVDEYGNDMRVPLTPEMCQLYRLTETVAKQFVCIRRLTGASHCPYDENSFYSIDEFEEMIRTNMYYFGN